MKPALLAPLIAFVFSACAYKPPTSKDYRDHRDGAMMNYQTFDLPVPVSEVKARMKKYSDKCYQNLVTRDTSYTTSWSNGVAQTSGGTAVTAYYPVWEELKGGFAHMLRGTSSGYDYLFILLDVTKKNEKETKAELYFPSRLGIFSNNLGENTTEWLNGRGKACSVL